MAACPSPECITGALPFLAARWPGLSLGVAVATGIAWLHLGLGRVPHAWLKALCGSIAMVGVSVAAWIVWPCNSAPGLVYTLPLLAGTAVLEITVRRRRAWLNRGRDPSRGWG